MSRTDITLTFYPEDENYPELSFNVSYRINLTSAITRTDSETKRIETEFPGINELDRAVHYMTQSIEHQSNKYEAELSKFPTAEWYTRLKFWRKK